MLNCSIFITIIDNYMAVSYIGDTVFGQPNKN